MKIFPTQWIAHRGASQVAPENTLAALRAAKALGATWVECDVMLTADRVPIIMHDETLERTTDAYGWVRQTKASLIAECDAGSWFSSAFSNERVPTLVDWLLCAAELDMGLNLELKAFPGDEALLAEAVVEGIQRHWPTTCAPPLLSSFSKACLEAIVAIAPQYPVSYVLEDWQEDWYIGVNQLNAVAVAFHHQALNARRVANVKASGCPLLAYTVDDRDAAEALFALGVDALFSNNTQLLSLS